MIVKPKSRGFICLTAHPVGCAKNVEDQVAYAKKRGTIDGAKNVLVIGGSTGYGLSSRVMAAFSTGAATLNISFEREAGKGRTATAGWYNNLAFDRLAKEAGLYAKSINGDAFSNEVKQQAMETIRNDMGKIDLIVYSLASPRRTHPITGEELKSVLKPIGHAFKNKTIDFHTEKVSEVEILPADDDEIRQTIGVMGGEDWEMWIDALADADLLADHAMTVAYSYIGPQLTYPVYMEGTIGQAKKDLERAAKAITDEYQDRGLHAYISVNKAVVTQASSAIPVVPLYVSILFKIMKEKGLHEGCVEQAGRLFHERLYQEGAVPTDLQGRIRLDDWELRDDVQADVERIWELVDTHNVAELTAVDQYRKDFFNLFGFERDDVNYDEDVEI